MKLLQRSGGRNSHQLRPITVSYNQFGYADASVLYQQGNTKVLCTVTLQSGVPIFLKGTKTGWLTAEYSLLPTATTIRSQRDGHGHKVNGRAVEISRFIGRALRNMVDLAKLGERTIIVDCDVLQADGGTRTASITGAALALKIAVERWCQTRQLSESIITQEVAAISIGVTSGTVLVDIDYAEDAAIDADYNFVFDRLGNIIEVQGTTERGSISWNLFTALCDQARSSVQQLFTQLEASGQIKNKHVYERGGKNEKEEYSFFSLKNRLSTDV